MFPIYKQNPNSHHTHQDIITKLTQSRTEKKGNQLIVLGSGVLGSPLIWD